MTNSYWVNLFHIYRPFVQRIHRLGGPFSQRARNAELYLIELLIDLKLSHQFLINCYLKSTWVWINLQFILYASWHTCYYSIEIIEPRTKCLLVSNFIKSPRYTGGDFKFMFLYWFVRRRRPQILVHAITFEQHFGFLSFLAWLLALTCRLPD